MTILSQLNDLRTQIADCRLVAFGDSDARLILKASHEEGVQREVLDGLCREATRLFDATDAVAGAVQSEMDEVVALSASETRIFLRVRGCADFLCLICEGHTDADQVLPQCGDALMGLVARS